MMRRRSKGCGSCLNTWTDPGPREGRRAPVGVHKGGSRIDRRGWLPTRSRAPTTRLKVTGGVTSSEVGDSRPLQGRVESMPPRSTPTSTSAPARSPKTPPRIARMSSGRDHAIVRTDDADGETPGQIHVLARARPGVAFAAPRADLLVGVGEALLLAAGERALSRRRRATRGSRRRCCAIPAGAGRRGGPRSGAR